MSPHGLRLGCIALCLAIPIHASADTKHVEELRVQKVGDVTYFHVRLQTPPNLLPEADRFIRRGWFQADGPVLRPRLIETEGQLNVVCPRISNDDRFGRGADNLPPRNFDDKKEEAVNPNKEGKKQQREPRQPERVQGLEFVGRVTGKGKVATKLLYPVAGKRLPLVGRFSRTQPAAQWKELVVTLDFDQAKEVAIPADAKARATSSLQAEQLMQYPPLRDDLEGLWAVAQIEQFQDLDEEVNEFGFYQFAALAMGRKYHVASPRGWVARSQFNTGGPRDQFDEPHELFELTTGAAAITESLQLRRMNEPRGNFEKQRRTVPIAKVRGIDIAEHPWKEMMGDKKPSAEPMAKLVPHDHYFVHFKRFASFVEMSDLMDQWGTSLNRAYQANSRDYRIKERYEQQLCLKSTALGRTLGPLVIEGVAITGSDPFLREGSDVSLLFQVKNASLFLAAVDPFIAEAKTKFGGDLTEDSFTQAGVKVEGFRTRYREVSVYRATLGNVVAYSNSPAAMRRIIDTHAEKRKPLADSLDYQYMRTVFRHADADESGFVFLSDAFIRTLVGPSTKIKEKRRLESLASMHMLTHGAMFAGWESGKEAESLNSILALSTLKPEEVPVPEGKPATWDANRHVPHSEVYNTPNFATPLIELPIDDVTQQEAEQYERFRLEYMGLWREFFDPIGVRLSLKDDNVQIDTYILPLIQNSAYNRLRRMTGSGTTKYAPKAIPANTLAQYLQHINPQILFGEAGLGRGDGFLLEGIVTLLNPIGDWYFVRLDDSPAIPKIIAAIEKLNNGEGFSEEDIAREAWQLPIVIGADIRNPVTLAAALTTLRVNVMKTLPGGIEWEPLKDEYKGVSIVRVGATRRGREQLMGKDGRRDPFLPAVYYAMTDGALYLTLNEASMKGMIDSIQSQKEGKLPTVEVNTSLFLSPKSAVATRALLEKYLEVQSHRQAMKSTPIWNALYRSRVVATDATAKDAEEAAFRFLGFVPVSPEAAAYRFDPATQEVVNERHGSLRQPKNAPTLADNSPLQILLRQIGTVRADLRFREDGIHTVVVIERQEKK